MFRRTFLAVAATALAVTLGTPLIGHAEDRFITVASTTSTQDSGLFEYLLPKFKEATGIDVHVIAQGTGQALDTGRRGDADVVFVHAKSQEEKFLADGFSTKRYPVMYNDFVVIGPKSDPAKIAGTSDAAAAFKAIADTKSVFVSRGDKSGTNTKELAIWKEAGITPSGDWYRAIGQGMGATLTTTGAMNGYTLSDRATWIAFKNKGDLEIAVEGAKSLLNQYGVMLVNPAKFPNVKAKDGQAFIDWLVSPEGQKVIAGFQLDGKQLFFPNANDPKA